MQQPEVIDERTINAVVEQQRLAVFESAGRSKVPMKCTRSCKKSLRGSGRRLRRVSLILTGWLT